MSKNEANHGSSLPPNVLWLRKHEGKTVYINYDGTDYAVTVERL